MEEPTRRADHAGGRHGPGHRPPAQVRNWRGGMQVEYTPVYTGLIVSLVHSWGEGASSAGIAARMIGGGGQVRRPRRN